MKKKSRFISLLSLALVMCSGFFTFTEAQYVSVPDLGNRELSHPLSHVLSFLQRITPLIRQPSDRYHASAEYVSILIPHETIVRYLDESADACQFYDTMRLSLVRTLIDRQYPLFVTQPYQENGAIILQSGDFKVIKDINQQDSLDQLLMPKLSPFLDDFTQIKKLKQHLQFNAIAITEEEYANLSEVFLFRNEEDLRALGYELISWKSRANVDREYRRHNIMAAFHNIGYVRLILPGEIFNLAREIHYTPGQGDIMYVSGYATFGAGSKMVYGGGLCGVATALYQGALTNLGLQPLEYKAHSTYYRNLFDAEINGVRISTPGLDATIYSSRYNLQLQNIRNYPIITVFNFGGGESDQEQVFTLSKAQDKGSLEFVGSRGKCFTWRINGKNQTNCYSYIKNY